MTDCTICCEKLNISNRKKVQCPFCDFSSCRSCVQKFLLSISADPHCMSCNKLWSREVIDGACTATFRNGDYKKHREVILFEREKCLMPATLNAVLHVKALRNLNVLIEEAQKEVIKAQRTVMHLIHTQATLRNGGTVETEKRKFVRKCPAGDCKGFLTTQWRCELCEKHICKDCNEVILEGHECDPGNVQTVELLKKDTKPCPSCGTMIFKISGCNQMWCPDCHTAFDWLSLRIETGRVHNPHYYDFQRTINNGTAPREPGDIPCGGLPEINDLYQTMGITRVRTPSTNEHSSVINIHRFTRHLEMIELAPGQRIPENNDAHRVQYMMNELSEDEFKKIIQRREKFREKARDVRQIFQMFHDIVSDHLRQFVIRQIAVEPMLETFEQLREYTNTAFERVQARYHLKTPRIAWNWSTNY